MRQPLILSVVLLAAVVAQLNAAIIPITNVTVSGPSNGSPSLINDNSIPPEGQFWQTNTVWWFGNSTSITVDFGSVYAVKDFLISVDNNDTYVIAYSTDNFLYTTLVTIQQGYGEIGGGMDTMSTDASHPEYVAGIDFPFVINARYMRITAQLPGDSSNSVGEFQAFSPDAAAVPEPATLALWGGLGFAGLVAARRRKNVAR